MNEWMPTVFCSIQTYVLVCVYARLCVWVFIQCSSVHFYRIFNFMMEMYACTAYILYIHWMQSIHTWFHWLLVKIDAEVTLAKLLTFQVIILIDNETNITTKWVYRWNKATQIKCYQKLCIYLTPNQIKLLELNWNALSLSLSRSASTLFLLFSSGWRCIPRYAFIHSLFFARFLSKCVD